MTDVHSLVRQYLVDLLKEDRERHLETPHGRPVYADADVVDENTSPTEADLDRLSDWLSDWREALRTRDFSLVKGTVNDWMARHGLDESQRSELSLGVLQAEIQYLETARRRVLEGVADPIEIDPQPRAGAAPVVSLPSAGPKLSEVLPGFIDLMTKDAGWRGQTTLQNKGTYGLLVQVCGDLPVTAYGRRELTALYDLLRGLPAMYAKDARWKRMTLSQVAESTKGDASIPRLTMKTTKRHFTALGSLFRYLIQRGLYEGSNPAHGYSFPQKGRPSQKRRMWEGTKLRQLFESPVWRGCKSKWQRSEPGSMVIEDERYWLPLLGLYHGNRLEEFAQLTRADVRNDGEIWYFDINDDGAKQVKNEQSKRRVPIHPRMLALGFLKYVEATAPLTDSPLFPNLTGGGADDKRGHAFTKWWTRYRKDIGLYEKGLDYHSFRHGVTTKLYAADVSDVLVNELTGHEGTGTSQTVYTKNMPLRNLFDAISKVEWPEVEFAQ